MEPNENYFNYQSMCGKIPISPVPQMMFQPAQPQQPLSISDALMRVNEVVCDLRHKYVDERCSQLDVNDLNDIINLTYHVGVLTVNMANILQNIKHILGGDQPMIRSAAESFSGSCKYAKNAMFDF